MINFYGFTLCSYFSLIGYSNLFHRTFPMTKITFSSILWLAIPAMFSGILNNLSSNSNKCGKCVYSVKDCKVNLKCKDNDVNELSVYGFIDGYTLSGVFNQSVSNSSTGTADINISAIDEAGLKTLGVCITDGIDSSCGAEIEAYFAGNKQVKTIDYCDASGNNCSSSDHYLYYF